MRIHDWFAGNNGKTNQVIHIGRVRSLRTPSAEREGWIVMHTHIFALLEVLATLLG
jgi:hypothetical protein